MSRHPVGFADRLLKLGAAGLTLLVVISNASYAQAADEKTQPSLATQVPTPAVQGKIAAPTVAAPQVPLPYKLITVPTNLPAPPEPATTLAKPAAVPSVNNKNAVAQTTKDQAAGPVDTPAKIAAPIVPPAPVKPQTTLVIDIDLTRQRMTLTEYGKQVGSWPISSGREGFRSPTGSFRPLWQSKMWYSKKYDNAPMPNAVFFSGGVAMHATQATGMLGRPASHGCIRQSPANAAATYKLVTKHGNEHTKIVVHGTPRDDEPRSARNDRSNDRPRLASRDVRPERQPTMRRVIMVDSYGNRRITEIPANDPRLLAYQNRYSAMAGERRSYSRHDW
jgi:lipoprotein-anchoring transpeptidase ErfK/SrfK